MDVNAINHQPRTFEDWVKVTFHTEQDFINFRDMMVKKKVYFSTYISVKKAKVVLRGLTA